jgi:hypothetical protein
VTNAKVLVNKATTAAGLDSTARINWATATDTGSLLPAFSSDLVSSAALQIKGSAALDLFGFVVGSADFDFASRTVDVNQNANGAFSTNDLDLDDATLLTIGLTNVNLFVGVGASLSPTNTLVTTGAIGFAVSGGNLGLAIVKANPTKIPGDNRTYIATRAFLGQAGRSSGCRRHQHQGRRNFGGHQPGLRSGAAHHLAPAALDWTKALDLDGDGLFGEAVQDILVVGGRTIDLAGAFTGVSGKLGLSAVRCPAGLRLLPDDHPGRRRRRERRWPDQRGRPERRAAAGDRPRRCCSSIPPPTPTTAPIAPAGSTASCPASSSACGRPGLQGRQRPA